MMTNKNNLNLPITILHEMDNVQYKIAGNLIKLDEKTQTCTVEFRNGRVESGIPMSDVYIAEGMMDTIKKYGKKFVGWMVEKVKGFIAYLNPDGEIDENSFNNAPNMVIYNAKGYTPKSWILYPSDPAVSQCEDMGISVKSPSFDTFMNDVVDDDIRSIERYWNRVMNIAGTTDKTIEESINYVNETYYHTTLLYKKLNEGATGSLLPDTDKFGNSRNGKAINTTDELVNLIMKNINSQLNISKINQYNAILDSDEFDDDEKEQTRQLMRNLQLEVNFVPRLLIWGAPGIGKTSIIKQALRDYKDNFYSPRNLNIYVISMAKKDVDSFRLPVVSQKKSPSNDTTIDEALLSFLPFYTPKPGDDAYNLQCENFYSSCKHLTESGTDNSGNEWQGGVLFLDELFRIQAHATNLIMNLASGEIGEKKLASNWAVICASNRASDDPNDDAVQDAMLMFDDPAKQQRFLPVTYVPSKEEWLKWATMKNEFTGEQNVDPAITTFISSAPNYVWYRTVQNGGYNREIKDVLHEDPAKWLVNGFGAEQIKKLREAEDDPDVDNFTKGNAQNWTSRTWDWISQIYRGQLEELFDMSGLIYRLYVKRSAEKYHYVGIHREEMKDALKKIPDETFAQWVTSNGVPYPMNKKTGKPMKLSMNDKLNMIQNVLFEIVSTYTGGPTYKISGTSEVPKIENDNLATEHIKKFYKWQDIFNDEKVIQSIYNTGLMPKGSDYAKKDDKGRSIDGGFEWKDNTAIIHEVENYIVSQYPGNGLEDFKGYLDYIGDGFMKCKNLYTLSGQKAKAGTNVLTNVEKIIKDSFGNPPAADMAKLKEYFTVHTETKSGDVIIFNTAQVNPVVNNILYDMIENSVFVRKFLNVVKYFIKICFTADNYASCGLYRSIETKKVNGKNVTKSPLKDLILSSTGVSGNQELSNKYINNVVNPDSFIMSELAKIVKENGASKVSNTILDLQYIDVFYLFRQCFNTAYEAKSKKNMSGKASED